MKWVQLNVVKPRIYPATEENTTEVLKRSLPRRMTSLIKEVSADVVSVLGGIMRCKDTT
jgi:hypothetical protein